MIGLFDRVRFKINEGPFALQPDNLILCDNPEYTIGTGIAVQRKLMMGDDYSFYLYCLVDIAVEQGHVEPHLSTDGTLYVNEFEI